MGGRYVLRADGIYMRWRYMPCDARWGRRVIECGSVRYGWGDSGCLVAPTALRNLSHHLRGPSEAERPGESLFMPAVASVSVGYADVRLYLPTSRVSNAVLHLDAGQAVTPPRRHRPHPVRRGACLAEGLPEPPRRQHLNRHPGRRRRHRARRRQHARPAPIAGP